MSLWSKAKEYVTRTGRKTGEVTEKVGYTVGRGIGEGARAVGRRAGEVYQKRWGPEGREERIAQYKARTQEMKAKVSYAREKQRLTKYSEQKRGSQSVGFGNTSILGKSSAPNYDYITGGEKKKSFKLKEFQI